MPRKLSPQQQRALLLTWVKLVKHPQPCDGFLAGTPLKAVYQSEKMSDEEFRRIRAKYACKNHAFWQFTYSHTNPWRTKGDANSRTKMFCWSHLIHRGIYGDMHEEERTAKRYRKLGVFCNSAHPETGEFCAEYGPKMDNIHEIHHTRYGRDSNGDGTWGPWQARKWWRDNGETGENLAAGD